MAPSVPPTGARTAHDAIELGMWIWSAVSAEGLMICRNIKMFDTIWHSCPLGPWFRSSSNLKFAFQSPGIWWDGIKLAILVEATQPKGTRGLPLGLKWGTMRHWNIDWVWMHAVWMSVDLWKAAAEDIWSSVLVCESWPTLQTRCIFSSHPCYPLAKPSGETLKLLAVSEPTTERKKSQETSIIPLDCLVSFGIPGFPVLGSFMIILIPNRSPIDWVV